MATSTIKRRGWIEPNKNSAKSSSSHDAITLSGSGVVGVARFSDAQARFNLRNLAHEGKVNTAEVRVFQRLLILLRQDPALAMAAARFIASSQQAQKHHHKQRQLSGPKYRAQRHLKAADAPQMH